MSSELESNVCYRVYGWRHLVKATEVTAGLAEIMALYRRVDGLKSPVGKLPAVHRDQLRTQRSVTSMGELFSRASRTLRGAT